MANPTIPELPNQSHRSGPASIGKGVLKTIQWVIINRNIATMSLRRLVISGPNRLPAIVKNMDEAEKHIAVMSAAISPRLGVMRAHELFSRSVTRLTNTFPA